MLNTLKTLFIERGKVDIRRRVLRLVLFGSILTFALLSVLSLIGVVSTWSVINERGSELSESATGFAEKFTEEQAHKQLLGTAEGKARLIRLELQKIGDDVKQLAAQMNRIFSEPQNYPPSSVPEFRQETVRLGDIYVFRCHDLANNPDPVVDEEIRLASNIEPLMRIITDQAYANHQGTISVGSKYNYVICVDVDYGKRDIITYSDDILRNYLVTARPWYIDAIRENKLVFSDFYFAPNGYPAITCAMPYYDNEGIAGVASIGGSLGALYNMIAESVNDASEINFVIDNKGRVIISSQKEGALEAGTEKVLLQDENLSRAIRRMLGGEKGIEDVTFDGTEYLLAFAPVENVNWYFGTMLRKNLVLTPAQEAGHNIELQIDDFKGSFRNMFIALMLVALLVLMRLLYSLLDNGIRVAGNFVKPIEELSDGVREIASGNFDKKLNVRTGDEIEHLAVCFNAMTDELQKYMANLTQVTAEKERIATELDVATEIQSSMLPRDFDFDRTDFELYATMHAAKEVGGDFYDFYLVDDEHLVVTIADVSGKGIAAALFMVLSKTILKNFAFTMTGSDDVGALVACTNAQLCQNNDAMMFVTAFVGVLELKTGRFTYVNGGHNPPLVYRASTDRFEYLNSAARNYALGLMDDVDYEQEMIELADGDVIYLYTDGVTEALNESEELYGEERLEECLNRAGAKNISVEKILAAVRKSLDEYVGDADQSDDITMIGLKYRGGAHD